MPRASDGPLYGLRRIFNRSRALRLSRALKPTLRAMRVSPYLAKCRDDVRERLERRMASYGGYSRQINGLRIPYGSLQIYVGIYFSLRRECRRRCTCGCYACASCCIRGYGCSAHSAFPAPSLSSRAVCFQQLGHFVPRDRRLASASAVMPRFMRGTQYAAASRLKHSRLWNTGSPGQAGR
jgi:hypothetical protein